MALALCLPLTFASGPAAKAASVVIIGDADGSGSVTKDDVTVLSRYIAGWEGYADKVDTAAADVNRDGKLTKADATILARYVADWDGYDMNIGTTFVKDPLTIVEEPLDVEMNSQSAVLSITVAGEFDSIMYDWQKKTASGWRKVATLNNDDVTYTVNNSALQIVSKNGTEGLGEYRCIVSAYYKGNLVDQVTSRTAAVDPQAAPMKALLTMPSFYTGTDYYYFYHTFHKTTEVDEETGGIIAEEAVGRILKNYHTQERFEYMSTPLQLIPDYEYGLDKYGDPIAFLGSVDGFYGIAELNRVDHPEIYKDENGDWWIVPATRINYVECSLMSVSGGKGPYTYTWYLSQDRFGNDVKYQLIEGYNCMGQGTETIRVWPFRPGTGLSEPDFLGFLCCRVTDSKGRTTTACHSSRGTENKTHTYCLVYAMDEDNDWFDSPNSPTSNGGIWWWTAPDNIGVGRWW